MVSGTMKDTINGIAMDVHDINLNRSFSNYNPTDMVTPEPGAYPLFESESGRANLEMPEDFFRITWRMEFINAKSNAIQEEKSRLFSAALYKKGFSFPAVKIAGIPTTRKSCDEGYLIIDSANQLYHLKMVKGIPFVKKVDLSGGIQFKHIACVDFRDKRYYAYLIGADDQVYILTQDEYELIRIPAGKFNAETDELKIYGDLFNYDVITSGDGFMDVVVLDKEYQKINEYSETWPMREQMKAARAFASLFPAQLSLTSRNSNFIRFYFTISKGFRWLIPSLLLMVIHFWVIRKRGRPLRHIADLAMILVTGVFGFIAVNIFPNRFFD
jgi:hypothetical protein